MGRFDRIASQEKFARTARRTADPSTALLRSSGRDDKGRAVTFRKGGDLDGRSWEQLLRRNCRSTMLPYHYRAVVASVIEGGASPGVFPQLRFGLLSISRISVPPLAISEWENHGLLSGLPLSRAD
jgi:hypothetical protein